MNSFILLNLFAASVLAQNEPAIVPYTIPTENVIEFIALGDSYSAGTGSNGYPEAFAGDAVRGKHSYPVQMSQDGGSWGFVNTGAGNSLPLPRFSFHAYTGDTTNELINKQLTQGDFNNDKDDNLLPRNQPFGKPQLAVMTIGGNDAGLSTYVW